MALVRNVFTVGAATLASRVAGFARDVLMAANLGTGPVADAFVVAFRLPNLFRRLFAEGAFNSAFVPLFAKDLAANGPASARAFAEDVLAIMFWSLALFTGICMMAMPLLVWAMAPGFAEDPAKFDDAVLFSQICFPYLMCMSLLALLGGVLNSVGRFAAAAWAPILLNVILSIALAAAGVMGHAGTREAGIILSLGVAIAGFAQVALLAFATERAGWRLALVKPRMTPEVKRMITLGIPGVIAGGAQQINLVVGTIIASSVPAAVSWLYYADRLYQLPLGVVGIAIGVVLLPELARQLREGDSRVSFTQNRAFELAMMLTLPASVALAVIPHGIIAALFERGAFTAADTDAVAWALFAFALGLPSFVLAKVLSPGFFAREDTKTPMYLGFVSVGVNVVLSFVLFPLMGHVGIALATSIAGWVNALMLWWILWRRGHFSADTFLVRRMGAIIAASAAMGVVLFGLEWPLDPYLRGSNPFVVKAGVLGFVCLAGFAVFAAVLVALKGIDHQVIKDFLARRRQRGAPAPSTAD